MLLIFVLIAVPLIEIALFVVVGGRIGLPATLAIVLVTAIAGGVLLRRQGQDALRRAAQPSSIQELQAVMTDGAMLLSAGLLLLTPGFFTDAIGFSLMIPNVRRWVAGVVARRATVAMAQRSRASGPGQGRASQSPHRERPGGGPHAPSGRPDDIEDAVELPVDPPDRS